MKSFEPMDLPRLALVALFAIWIVGCEGDTINNNLPSGPSEIYTVVASGTVRALPSGFQACDSSVCTLDGKSAPCGSVTWSAESRTTGIKLETRAGTVAACIQFSGVPSGSYVVEQRAKAADLLAVDSQTHNVTVAP